MHTTMLRLSVLFLFIIVTGCSNSAVDTIDKFDTPLSGIIDFNDHDTGSGTLYTLDFANNTLTKLPFNGFGPERTPENTILYAYLGINGGISEIRIDSTPIPSTSIGGFNPRLSHDGKLVASETSNNLTFVTERTTGKILYRSDSIFILAASPSWTSDGNIIIMGATATQAGLFSISPNSKLFSYLGPGGLYPNVSADGTKICYVKNHEHIFVSNIDGSGEIQLTDTASNYHHPCWSPNGKWIAAFAISANPKLVPDKLLFIRVSDHSVVDARKYFPTGSFGNFLYQLSWK
ncbi:MAG TPA: hypothetical protein VFO76_04520 [Candidatus Kapabacteria bacterium]|nr:hypothetical protein [Candidatus Kapabacteria bacterium]